MKDGLIAGGGNTGSYACKTLAAAGYHPVLLDNFVFGHRDFVRRGPLVETEIRRRHGGGSGERQNSCWAAAQNIGEGGR